MVLAVAAVKGSLGAQVGLVLLQMMVLHISSHILTTVLLNMLTLGQVTFQFTQWPLPLAATHFLTVSKSHYTQNIVEG